MISSRISSIKIPSDLADTFKFILCVRMGFINDLTSKIEGENLFSKKLLNDRLTLVLDLL